MHYSLLYILTMLRKVLEIAQHWENLNSLRSCSLWLHGFVTLSPLLSSLRQEHRPFALPAPTLCPHYFLHIFAKEVCKFDHYYIFLIKSASQEVPWLLSSSALRAPTMPSHAPSTPATWENVGFSVSFRFIPHIYAVLSMGNAPPPTSLSL